MTLSTETLVFVKPDLLQPGDGFDTLKAYLSNNTPKYFTRISRVKDGNIAIKSFPFDADEPIGTQVRIADTCAIRDGYWKMSIASLREFLGLD